MKNKPCRWGFFFWRTQTMGTHGTFLCTKKSCRKTVAKGLSYESVIGTVYKIFVEKFYTSPSLFSDLLQKMIWGCGTIQTNIIGFPKTKINSLVSKSLRGSIRWIRKESLLFVQWRDKRDVFMCSTLHTAHRGTLLREQ